MKLQVGAFSKEKAPVGAFSVIENFLDLRFPLLPCLRHNAKQTISVQSPGRSRGPAVDSNYSESRLSTLEAHIGGIMETCGELGSVFRLVDSVGCVTATHL